MRKYDKEVSWEELVSILKPRMSAKLITNREYT